VRELWFWEWQPPEQMVTQVLRPPPHVERDRIQVEAEALERRRAFGRKAGAKARREKTKFPEPVLTEIARYPGDKHSPLARRLKNNPATRRLVARWKLASLAKKISLLRRQKQSSARSV
jgi:hypothetical protein